MWHEDIGAVSVVLCAVRAAVRGIVVAWRAATRGDGSSIVVDGQARRVDRGPGIGIRPENEPDGGASRV